MPLVAVDWTNVIVAAVAGLPAIIAAVGVILVRIAIRTPSGNPIGQVAEMTHDLSAVDVALTKAVHAKLSNGAPEPEPPRPLGAHTRKDDKP